MIFGDLVILEVPGEDRVNLHFSTRSFGPTPREQEQERAIGLAILKAIEEAHQGNPDIFRTDIADRSTL